jgi:hypothetical protein
LQDEEEEEKGRQAAMRSRSAKAVACVAAAALCAFAVSSSAEVVQQGNLRVAFEGKLSPRKLPRKGTRPVAVSIGGQVHTADGSEPPQLRKIEIAINRHGKLDYKGLPTCRLEEIQPSTDREALQACKDAKVGEGRFFANVSIPGQAPFPSRGRLIAFNGIEDGKPAIFAHVYGPDPVPTSYTLPLRIGKTQGAFSTTLTAALPHVTGKAGFITGIRLALHRNFTYKGRPRSYLSAGCPAPKGLSAVPFKLARATFAFAGQKLSKVLVRSCGVG